MRIVEKSKLRIVLGKKYLLLTVIACLAGLVSAQGYAVPCVVSDNMSDCPYRERLGRAEGKRLWHNSGIGPDFTITSYEFVIGLKPSSNYDLEIALPKKAAVLGPVVNVTANGIGIFYRMDTEVSTNGGKKNWPSDVLCSCIKIDAPWRVGLLGWVGGGCDTSSATNTYIPVMVRSKNGFFPQTLSVKVRFLTRISIDSFEWFLNEESHREVYKERDERKFVKNEYVAIELPKEILVGSGSKLILSIRGFDSDRKVWSNFQKFRILNPF